MIRATNITFGWGSEHLFEKASFIVGKNQKVGLVGANGAGKSTLLKLILGLETPSQGKIETQGVIGYVPQEVVREEHSENTLNVRDYVDPDNKQQDFEIQKLFSGLELSLNLKSDLKNLSGGQKTKLALARALIEEPDVLLLDEPTNFMDIAGKKWVAEFLSSYPKTLILISHDLELMDRAIDKVLAVNSQTKLIDEFKGNYKKAMKLKDEKEALARRQIISEQKHIKRLEKAVEKMRQRNKSKKGVRARVVLQRRVERLKENLPDLPEEVRKIKISLPEPASVGELPIRAINISKSYGNKKVLDNVNLSVRRGERVALIGPNGSGKSTLIKVLTERLNQDSGEVIRNQSLKYGYYSQEFESFDFNKSLVKTIMDDCLKDENFARSFLRKYMFFGDKIYQSVGSLSGGEKTRLSIARLTADNYNLLILDEPTTYLDVVSQRVILEALKEYKGAMLAVSHTEAFIKELQPSRALIFPENRFTFWSDDLLEKVELT